MSDDEGMSLVAFRFTHSLIPGHEDLDGAKKITHMVKKVLKRWELQKYIWCIETKDKFGKDTHPHIHFNAECIGLPTTDGIRKAMKREFEKNDIVITGKPNRNSRVFAISRPQEIDDMVEWWRYPLKQTSSKVFYTKDMKEFVDKWRLVAQDQWERQVKQNNQAVDNFLDKSSFKGKMFEQFQKENVNTEREFVIRYVKYCFEKSKTPSYTKIGDYWIEYQMRVGLMTIEDWVDAHYFK